MHLFFVLYVAVGFTLFQNFGISCMLLLLQSIRKNSHKMPILNTVTDYCQMVCVLAAGPVDCLFVAP